MIRHEIASALHTDFIGRELILLEETDSTNDELRRRYISDNAFKDGTVVISELQTAGRGRRGRSWQGRAGENIAMSIFLRPSFSPDRASMLTIPAALTVRRSCEEALKKAGAGDRPCNIKWPNDILVNGKKVCGILTEMSASSGRIDYVIVGIGINVNSLTFPEEIADMATSLRLTAGSDSDIKREPMIADILNGFEEFYVSFLRSSDLSALVPEYNSVLAGLGGEVKVLDPAGGYTGISRGIDERGELLVECGDGEVKKVYAGEVSIRGDWY